jgi:2-oxoglutarate ferredoxin oxidoreductase subunit alpha
VYEVTVAAFNLSEAYRVPVVLLLDATLSNVRENVELPLLPVVNRRPPAGPGFQPFAGTEFQAFGDGAPFDVTGLAHAASGRPRASDGPNLDRMLRRSIARIESANDVIRYRGTALEDAEHLILAYGITARSAAGAVQLVRRDGYGPACSSCKRCGRSPSGSSVSWPNR